MLIFHRLAIVESLSASLFALLFASLLISCGDIQTAFFIREDSTATIRYTYLAERELSDSSEAYRHIVFSVDSSLSILKRDRAIQGFKRSPIYGRQYVQLDIELDHYSKIDSIHRLLYSSIAPLDKIGLMGIDKEMRDSIVFLHQGDSLQMQILNWIPDTATAKRMMIEAIEGMQTIAIKLDSLQLRKGGKDSARAAARMEKVRVLPDLQGATLKELSQTPVGEYVIPSRYYELNAPLILHSDNQKFSALKTSLTMTEASWIVMHYRPSDLPDDLGKTPTVWFRLNAPSRTDRQSWANALGICEECEDGFRKSGAQGAGLTFYSNKQGVTYALIDCGRDSIGRRTIVARLGHSDSLGYYGASERMLVMQAQSFSDTILSWAGDRLVGDVTFDEAAGTLRVVHEMEEHGVRSLYDLNGTEPVRMSVERIDHGKWTEHFFKSGMEKFISRDPIHCADREN